MIHRAVNGCLCDASVTSRQHLCRYVPLECFWIQYPALMGHWTRTIAAVPGRSIPPRGKGKPVSARPHLPQAQQQSSDVTGGLQFWYVKWLINIYFVIGFPHNPFHHFHSQIRTTTKKMSPLNSSLATNISMKLLSVYELHKSSLITWMVIVLTVNISGAFINAVTFIATLTYRPLRHSSSSWLLAHCIFIDLFVSLVIGPGLVLVTFYGSQPLPQHFCEGWGFTVWTAIYTSNWSHAMLAMHRFIATIFPFRYSQLTAKPMLIAAVIFPWFIAISLNSFMAAGFHVRFEMARPWISCTPGPVNYAPLNALVALGVYIPCCITGLGYTIVLVTSKVAVSTKISPDVAHSSALNKRYETAKMLFVSFLWNSLSNFIVPIGATFYPKVYFTNPLMQLAFKSLQYMSNAVNPVNAIFQSE